MDSQITWVNAYMYIYRILLKILERTLNSCLLLDYLKLKYIINHTVAVCEGWCSFSMMVKWVNYGLLQSNDGKMHVNDDQMLVNGGGISIWSCTHFTIIDYHFAIIKEHFTIISLKYTIIRSFDHNWEAAPTARVIFWIDHTQLIKSWRFFANFNICLLFKKIFYFDFLMLFARLKIHLIRDCDCDFGTFI